MVRSILEIGNAKYKIDRYALSRFKQEARQHAACNTEAGAEIGVLPFGGSDGSSVDASLDAVFGEVMKLYNEYARTESLDVLVLLKCKLEEVSLRYRSLALAEEVLNINSCLPYERRVPSATHPTDSSKG